MNEEISLREIIEIMSKYKWVVFITTIAMMLIASTVSLFVIRPTYETYSMVRIESTKPTNEVNPTDIRQFQETLKSSSTIQSIIEKNDLDSNEFSINSIRGMFDLETVPNSNMLKIVVRGGDADKISSLANILAFELGIRIEINDRTKQIVEAQSKLNTLTDQVEVIKAQIVETESLLKETPEKIVTSQTLAANDLMRDVVQERNNLNAIDAANLQMLNESINPVYTELKTKLTQLKVQLQAIETEAKVQKDTIDSNIKRIDEIEGKSTNDKLDTNKSIRIMDGTNAIFINPSIANDTQVGPKVLLNTVVAGAIGFVLSLLAVFFRHYMKETSRG